MQSMLNSSLQDYDRFLISNPVILGSLRTFNDKQLVHELSSQVSKKFSLDFANIMLNIFLNGSIDTFSLFS